MKNADGDDVHRPERNPWYAGTLVAAFGGVWLLLAVFVYEGVFRPMTGQGSWPAPIGLLSLGLLLAALMVATYFFGIKHRMRPP